MIEEILTTGKAKYPIWIVTQNYNNYIKAHKDIIKYPSEKDTLQALKEDKKVFLAPYLPNKELEDFLVVKYLRTGLLTPQEEYYKVTESEALQNKLKISVLNSEYSLDDLAGAKVLKEWAKKYLIAEEKGYKTKGIFLVGVPGTGKTFFPQCLSGEFKRPLIMLNLAEIKENRNPIQSLNDIFSYLNKTTTKQILLLDEVEKMIEKGDDPLTGRLMTILNDLGNPTAEYNKLNLLVFATANNLDSILNNQPAFLRRGRFDELFFVNMPTNENAQEIYELYLNKYKLNIIKKLFDLEDLIILINETYKTDKTQVKRHIYSPSEIHTFVKRLDFIRMTKQEITIEDIKQTIIEVIPLLKSAKKGLSSITAQKELFVEI